MIVNQCMSLSADEIDFSMLKIKFLFA